MNDSSENVKQQQQQWKFVHRHTLAGFSQKFTSSAYSLYLLFSFDRQWQWKFFSSPQNTELGKITVDSRISQSQTDEIQTPHSFPTNFIISIYAIVFIYVPLKWIQFPGSWRLMGKYIWWNSHMFYTQEVGYIILTLSTVLSDNDKLINISSFCTHFDPM